eukprot:c18642_g1_i1.p1 GENE.c18642_g1_i1~~c18642_g1_i1.p1  ORF type:complete len:210 (+),score=51.13 c18642_g1_i1:79-708(+)
MEVAQKEVKCVVVGDGAVGKTCLLMSYTTQSFPTEYVPTVFDNYSTNIMVNGSTITLGLWDTAGQEEFDQLRPLSYSDANIFLVCFAVTSPVSFENVKSKWLPELAKHQPKAPTVLVGTKSDLRTDQDILNELARKRLEPVSPEKAQQFAESHQMSGGYVECSARTLKGVKEVFDRTIHTVLVGEARGHGASTRNAKPTDQSKPCCVIL